jgi:hypothetical protein
MPTNPVIDPFQNDDPKWQPHELQREENNFSMPDLTSRSLKDFLRTLEVRFPKPQPPAPQGERVLPHIRGFPG